MDRIYILRVSLFGQIVLAVLFTLFADLAFMGVLSEHRMGFRALWLVVALLFLALGVGAVVNGFRIVIARLAVTFGFWR